VPPSIDRKRLAGILLFLVVTACWVLGLVSADQDWIAWHEAVFWIAWILSALSVVLTGYLGRIMDAVWLGWIPGAVQLAVGLAIDNTLILVGGLVLIGWAVYFLPLIALGVWLRHRRAASAPTS
jgi:hypothetical protein